ncbi:hypothetical protein I5G61_gp82 [Mycobacterium phage Quesadilla]|uniref:Uncharacterized protein n=1 Tax=Mycobacterium phage Quesadilla TaxID=2664226 RepID=A0A5Q2WD50_9CAUD|nr:hypothetical protein I5G61_gp82 [Mycobacterium phage Quesadilla]QGH75330.1 hypothetical protein SEA_QUESADILLA_82 [Mycobacterium phage Quesadilla]
MSLIDGLKNAKQAADMDIAGTVAEFQETLGRIERATELAADAAVAALVGEFGVDGAANLLKSAQALREAQHQLGVA